MWCAFEGPPRIVRIHGRGRVVTPDDAEWDDLLGRLAPHPGQRSIVVVSAERVSDACGDSVPKMDFVEERSRLDDWASSRSEEELRRYRRRKSSSSIDGLPGALRASGGGAGEGNRTLVNRLETCGSTIELHPQGPRSGAGRREKIAAA